MADLATFRIQYPEFAGEADAYTQPFLTDAALEIPADIYGSDYDRAVYLYAAARMYERPFARDQGLSRQGLNPYDELLRVLRIRKANTQR